MSEIVKCIDISHWQGYPDFNAVRASGVIAMIHKCTEGTGYVDPNRVVNCRNAIAAGISVATYHWIKPGSNAAAQMKFYLDTLQPVRGERVIIDYEENGCTLDQLIEAVKTLKADSRDLQVTVYSGHLLKQQLANSRNEYLAANTDLWLAQYTGLGKESWPTGTYPEGWTLWQYSESGKLPGITDAAVDLNRFEGKDEELLDWIRPARVEAPPPPPEVLKIVKVNITVPDDVGVRIHVNGREVS
jgi:lysozyme